jgi:hypothetical protein
MNHRTFADQTLNLIRLRSSAAAINPVRCGIGLLAFLHAFEMLLWLNLRAATPDLPLIPYPHLAFLAPPPAALVTPIIMIWTTSAFLFAFGVRPRLTGAIVTAVMAYILVCDQALTTNHGYLIMLEVLLLTIAASTRHGQTIARWPLFLAMCLLSLVYAFAAAAKLNSDFLSGAVLRVVLGQDSLVMLPQALLHDTALRLISLAAIATELFLAVGFWNTRTRAPAAAIGACLHVSIQFVFPFNLLNAISFLQVGGAMVMMYPLFFLSCANSANRTHSRHQVHAC